MTDKTASNREEWLRQVADRMAPAFAELGAPLPKFRAAIGFPVGSAKAISGQCWDRRVSGDGHFEIFINPVRDDSQAIASTLGHELIHAAVGLQHGHKGEFARVALALGYPKPLTQAKPPTEKLAAWLDGIISEVGPIPHARIAFRDDTGVVVKRTPAGIEPSGGDSEGGEDDSTPKSSGPKPQTGRLLKACCEADGCGYTVRVTAKWLQVGPPHCPLHGAMNTDGGA